MGVKLLQAQEGQGLPETPEARKKGIRILPWGLQREDAPADTLILNF